MKGRNGRRVSACQKPPQGESLEKYDFFFVPFFSHHLGGGVERNRRRIRQKTKKLGGCVRSPRRSPEGFPRSEAQPSWNAKDCFKLNCAVVFYTIVNCGILGEGMGHMARAVSVKEALQREAECNSR